MRIGWVMASILPRGVASATQAPAVSPARAIAQRAAEQAGTAAAEAREKN